MSSPAPAVPVLPLPRAKRVSAVLPRVARIEAPPPDRSVVVILRERLLIAVGPDAESIARLLESAEELGR